MFAARKLPFIVESMEECHGLWTEILADLQETVGKGFESNRKGSRARLIIFAVFTWFIKI